MEKTPTDISTDGSVISTSTSTTETRTLRDVVHSSKRTGGNYGSLAKSQIQPIFYISHKVESDDTLQRLSLKYSITIQEIKRVNKLWSDAELGLLEHVYIPVNPTQLATLQTVYPTLNIIQSLSPLMNHLPKSSINTSTDDETTSSIRSSDSSTSISTNSSYQDYFSKIDQQIRLTKKSLQSLDIKDQNPNSQSNTITSSDPSENNGRHKGVHHLSDNSAFVNISTQDSREKHVASALKRIQREKDNFDEL